MTRLQSDPTAAPAQRDHKQFLSSVQSVNSSHRACATETCTVKRTEQSSHTLRRSVFTAIFTGHEHFIYPMFTLSPSPSIKCLK